MAVRQFAIPLDSNSKQTGNRTFKELKDGNVAVTFKLGNVVASTGTSDKLNLKTKKGGVVTAHEFTLTFSAGTASVTVSKDDIIDVYNDANGGNWDYVEAEWTVGYTDTPITSVETIEQSNVVYDYNGWPPQPS